MPVLSAAGLARARELEQAIRTIQLGGPPFWDELLPLLRELLRAEKTLAFHVLETRPRRRLNFLNFLGPISTRRLCAVFEPFLETAPPDWNPYDLSCPPAAERNVVVRPRAVYSTQTAGKSGGQRSAR